jgi:hypothetical protein
LWVDTNKKGGRNITSTTKDKKEKRKKKRIHQGLDNSILQLSDTTD